MLSEDELAEVRSLIDKRERLVTKILAMRSIGCTLIVGADEKGAIRNLRRLELELHELGVPVEPALV